MTLDKFIEELMKLQKKGHGQCEVFAVEGSSGCASELSYPYLRKFKEASSPDGIDLEEGEKYIEVYSGN